MEFHPLSGFNRGCNIDLLWDIGISKYNRAHSEKKFVNNKAKSKLIDVFERWLSLYEIDISIDVKIKWLNSKVTCEMAIIRYHGQFKV